MAKFEKGSSRPAGAGRKAGTPNKRTQDLFEKCENLGLDPFEALLLIARDGEKEETRIAALKELCKYLYPQRKAVEHSANQDKGFVMIVKDYSEKKKD